MAKIKKQDDTDTPATGGWMPPANFAGFVKQVVGRLGGKSGKADVLDAIARFHGAEAAAWAEGKGPGLSVAINNANKSHGYASGRGGARVASGEPTLADLMAAQELLRTLGMTSGQLLKLVGGLKTVGDLDTLEQCLTAIDAIQSAGGKAK